MEPVAPQTPTKQNGWSNIIFVSMAFLYGLVCLCLGAVVFVSKQQIPGIRNYFPTITPTPTKTPLAHKPTPGDQITKDDFAFNSNKWAADENSPLNNVYVKDGKLFVVSQQLNNYAVAQCTLCPKLKNPYFIQADFSTKQETDEAYGIMFNAGAFSHSDFYLFSINAKHKMFSLYKYQNQLWMLRISKQSDLIKPYPQINTLAVSMDQDLIGIYINGDEVETYQDTGSSLDLGIFQFYASNSGFTLIVDNFYAYGK